MRQLEEIEMTKVFDWVGLIVSDHNGTDGDSVIVTSSRDQREGKAMVDLAFQLAEQRIRNKNEGFIEVKEFHGEMLSETDRWTETLFRMELKGDEIK